MLFLRKFCLMVIGFLILAGCSHPKKKPSLTGDETVAISDFIEFFRPLTLPFVFADTSLQKKESDSVLISRKIFAQFAPDSILTKIYGKANPKIYAIGKAGILKEETYLFIKTITADKKALLLLAFDKKQQYLAGLTALQLDNNPSTTQSLLMDRRLSITKSIQQRSKDGNMNEGKDVYELNAVAKNFTLIMTDALVDNNELVNPIDTLARKNKWSADYINGKTNLVSIRDGRRSDRVNFFIHFDKNNGACSGELKGEALVKSNNTAEYHVEGDPCILKFIFSSSSVTLQEVEGCGSKRQLNCSLNGSFSKAKR